MAVAVGFEGTPDIAGGGNDIYAEPFHVEWTLNLRDACRSANSAFFLKQLGQNPFYQGRPLKLVDPHGSDWNEWAVADWKLRESPLKFQFLKYD